MKSQNKTMLDLKNSISQMKASGESFAIGMIHGGNRDLEMKDKVEELNLQVKCDHELKNILGQKVGEPWNTMKRPSLWTEDTEGGK